MKRCPICNRFEADDVLAFCRADGTALISDSPSIDQKAGAKIDPQLNPLRDDPRFPVLLKKAGFPQ
jgi:hypothetical protein